MTSPTEGPQQIPEQPPQERSADSAGAAGMVRLFMVAIGVVVLTLLAAVAGQIYFG